MAAKYRKIDPRIWNDEKFDNLDQQGVVVAFHVLTSDSTNRCGISVSSLGVVE